MRWLGGITVILLAIGAALVGAGFLLPAKLDVSQEAVIQRPRATVLAILSNLDAVQEFLPMTERDPSAVFTLSGPPGVGQSLKWSSRVPALGAGEMRIAEVKPLEQVIYRIRAAHAPASQAVITVSPVSGVQAAPGARGEGVSGDSASAAVTVSWRFVSDCGSHWRQIPCRYANVLARPIVEADLAIGLRRLDRVVSAIPDADFEGLKVEPAIARASAFAFVERAAADQPGRAEEVVGEGLTRVRAFLGGASLTVTGAPIAMVKPAAEDGLVIEIGLPFEGPAPIASGDVKVGRSPDGAALKVLHSGTYASRSETYRRLEAYIAAHRLATIGAPWEVVLKVPALDTGASEVEIWRRIDTKKPADHVSAG